MARGPVAPWPRGPWPRGPVARGPWPVASSLQPGPMAFGYSLGAMVAGQAEVDLLRMTVKAQKDVRAQKRELEAEVHTQ